MDKINHESVEEQFQIRERERERGRKFDRKTNYIN